MKKAWVLVCTRSYQLTYGKDSDRNQNGASAIFFGRSQLPEPSFTSMLITQLQR